MSNPEIAEKLAFVGKLLLLKGENVFRVRAYERAAQAIIGLPLDLKGIYDVGGRQAVMGIDGIGEDLSLKIEEMLTTGKLAYLEKLTKEIPKGLLEIMKVQGMGPKKTKFVWETFGVTTLPALKRLAESGKLQPLKGWGDKSVANILEGLSVAEITGKRIPLKKALPAAEKIIAGLRQTKLCEEISMAGSLRRKKETIGDIDILASSVRPTEVMEWFCGMPGVVRVLGKGATKSSVLLKGGMQADLRVVPREVFGAALHYFTGSKEHNVQVRQLALQKGFTLSEYGLFRGTAKKKGGLVACRTEEDVFRAVGLRYIPPEKRLGTGEVEAARLD